VEAQWIEKDRKRLREATTIISQANLAKTLSISRAAITQAKKMIEEPRSKLRGMFCRAAVLRSDRKEFCLI
jgi:DNA-binding XRE family transcriptional regulator